MVSLSSSPLMFHICHELEVWSFRASWHSLASRVYVDEDVLTLVLVNGFC